MYARSPRLMILLATLVMSLALAAPVFASNGEPLPVTSWQAPGQEAEDDHSGEIAGVAGAEDPVAKTVIWMLAGIVAGGVIFTALYMLKKRVGGFPENPDWVAPITILYSKDAPAEGAFGGDTAGHGDANGAHH